MPSRRETMLRYIRRLASTLETDQVSDAALLDRFIAERDQRAFTALVQRHGAMVLQVCRRVLGNADDADDAFQGTFLVLARKAAAVRPREALAAWLHGVARRVALKTRAARIRYHETGPLREAPADGRADPLAELSARELLTIIDEEVQRLPERYRLPLILCSLEGRSLEEAARLLGWTPGSVKGRLERGRARLHDRLFRRGLTLSAALAAVEASRATASATVLAELIVRTIPGALAFGASRAMVTGVSTSAAAVAGRVVMAMAFARLTMAAALLLTTAALGAGFALHRKSVEPASTQPATAFNQSALPKPQSVVAWSGDHATTDARTDAYGDPLPPTAFRRVGTLRFRTEGTVNCLLLTPDGKTLVSSSDYYGQHAVCVWEMASGRLLRQFGNYDLNSSESWIALSPDGRTVAVCRRAVITLWDLASGERVHILRGEKVGYGVFAGLAFAPDGKTLAAGDGRGTIHFWDLSTGKPSGRLPTQRQYAIASLTYSPDGKILASADRLGSGLIKLWDVASRTLVHELTRPSVLYGIAFSPDSSTLTAGARDGTIPLWDVKTGQLLRELHGLSDRREVRAVGFSLNGKVLATGDFDNKQSLPVIRLWDAATGKEVRRIEGRFHGIESLAFSADSKTVITSGSDNIIRLWDVATGTEQAPRGNQGYVGSVTRSPDGRTLAYVNRDSIRLLDLATGEEIGSLPTSFALSLAFSPDGTTLAAGTHENAIFLWDVGTRKLRGKLEGDKKNDGLANGFFLSLAFSPDGKVLISGNNDAAVQFWDVTTGKELRRLTLKDAANEYCNVTAVAVSSDGRLLAASGRAQRGNAGRITRLWETTTGKELQHLTLGMNERSGERPQPFPSWVGILSPQIVFSPDGKMLAINRLDKTIAVWEVASGKQRCVLQGQEATVCFAFSPDSRLLASADWDNTIRLWGLQTGKELRRLTGHRGKVNSLAFSVDGTTLISAAHDTTLLFWDLSGDRQTLRLPRPRSSQEPETLWSNLADSDASRAYQAITALRETPAQTVPFLQRRLQPARTPDSRQIARLMDDLDSQDFEVRQKATAELTRLGDLAEPALREKLVHPPSLEARQRIEQLLAGQLVYSTYLGGSGDEQGLGIAVDQNSHAYVTGITPSTDFPTLNAFQPVLGTMAGFGDAFVASFDPTGQLLYSTYLGGRRGAGGYAIDVDQNGDAYVTGITSSSDFPTVNPFQPALGGPPGTQNAFVVEFSADGSALLYSTYLGGSGGHDGGDFGTGIAVDQTGQIFLTGTAGSPDFPTLNAIQPTLGGAGTALQNAFVTSLSPGGGLLFSTYLGGSIDDLGQGVAVDAAGNTYVSGKTFSPDFPTTVNAFQPAPANANANGPFGNGFVAKISP